MLLFSGIDKMVNTCKDIIMNDFINIPHELLIRVLEAYPEFIPDLDETACDIGTAECPICEGSIGNMNRGKKIPARNGHKPNCPNDELRKLAFKTE